jgi:hypothetical protein
MELLAFPIEINGIRSIPSLWKNEISVDPRGNHSAPDPGTI